LGNIYRPDEGNKESVSVQVSKGSITNAISITPSDTASISPTKGIYIGGSGHVNVVLSSGNQVTFSALSSGMVHPISVTKIRATGTTATSILAVY
jgi:hypothetical protein